MAVYQDTRGIDTVGIGFNMQTPNAKRVWKKAGIDADFDSVRSGEAALSQEEAYRLAQTSYRIALSDIRDLVPNFDDLTPARQEALADMSYQMGKPRLSKFKNTLGAIKRGDYVVAAREVLKSDYAKQTPARARRIAKAIARG